MLKARNFVNLNFNDFINSMVFLYTMTIGNDVPMLVNMAGLMKDQGDVEMYRRD